MRTAAEIDQLIGEWEALRADYSERGAAGIVDFINAEIHKLCRERETARAAETVTVKPVIS
jgi:hypothetical protein